MRNLSVALALVALVALFCVPASAQVTNYVSYLGSSNPEARDNVAGVFKFGSTFEMIDYRPLHIHIRTTPALEGHMYVREQSAPIDELDFTNNASLHWEPDVGALKELAVGWTHHSNGQGNMVTSAVTPNYYTVDGVQVASPSRSYDVYDGAVTFGSDLWEGSFGRFYGTATVHATWNIATGSENADLPDLVSFFGIEDLSGSATGTAYYYPPNDSLPSLMLSVSGSMKQFNAQFAYNFNADWQKFWTGIMVSSGIMETIDRYNQQTRTVSAFVGKEF
jgi:hypothetical protein